MSLFSHWLFWLATFSLAGWLYLILWRGAFGVSFKIVDPAGVLMAFDGDGWLRSRV